MTMDMNVKCSKELMTERRFIPAPIVDSSAIPKDEATQKLITHMAEKIYQERLYFNIPGDALSDWIMAEKQYMRTFMRRRYDDKL